MPLGEPTALRDDGEQDRQARRVARRALRQRFEGEHDQRVARQHRDRRAEFDMNRRLAAPQSRVVETGQIVVNQRGAMQQFDRRRRGVRGCGIAIAAGLRHRQAELRPNAVAAGKDRITQGRGEERRGARALRRARQPVPELARCASEACMSAPFMCQFILSF